MRQTRKQHPHLITASEVAEFTFCAQAWHLKRAGYEPDSPHLEAGTAFHRRHGNQLSFARTLQLAGWSLLGIVLLLVLLLMWRWQ